MADNDELKESDLGDTGDLVIEDLGDEHVMDFQEEPAEEQPEPEESEEPEEEEAEEEPEKKEPEEKPEKAEKAAGKEKVIPTEEDPVVKYLGGKDATIKVKGKEYKLSEFKSDEVKTFLQLGLRGTQRLQEVADKERDLTAKEAALNEAANRINLLQQRVERPAADQAAIHAELPPDLKPNEMDSEELKAIKSVAAQSWRRSQELAQRLDQYEGRAQSQQNAERDRAFVSEIAKMKETDFPAASLEEVIAVHALRPDIPVREIVKKSHEIYNSRGHIDNILKINPLLRREIKEEMVREYLADQKRTPKVAGRPSSTGTRTVAPTRAQKPPRTFEEAGKAAKVRLAELIAAEKEEAD